jgi:hypothetical protein
LGAVPQVSVLGTLLFIIYINDIADKLTSLTRLFADDTSFNFSHSDGTEIQSIINHDLKELDEWPKRWLMTFNPDKTEIMLFTNLEYPEINFTFEKSLVREANLSAMSFIYILNSKGPRTDPWGTPPKIVVKLEDASLITTLCSRSFK